MGKRLIVNTALMTSASLLMRCIAMGFQGYLSGRIGAAGIGLYQLVMSVELLATTFAVSGIRFAVTRLVSEELGLGRAGGVHGAMVRSVLYALFFGSAAMLLLTRFAEPIGFLWIGDARTVLSLRILAFGLPCLSLSSVLSGYFTACGRIWKPSLVHLVEQCAVVAFVSTFLARADAQDIERSCAAVCAGVTASDILSLALMLCFYAHDRRRHGSHEGSSFDLTSRMLSVALPLAVSAYALITATVGSYRILLIGVADGIQPLASYANGAGDWNTLRRLRNKGIGTAVAVSAALFAFTMATAGFYPALYGYSGQAAELSVHAVRVTAWQLLFTGLVRVTNGFFFAVGKTRYALFMIYFDPLVLTPAALLVLPRLLGLEGIWLTAVVTQLLLNFAAGWMFWRYSRALARKAPAAIPTERSRVLL